MNRLALSLKSPLVFLPGLAAAVVVAGVAALLMVPAPEPADAESAILVPLPIVLPIVLPGSGRGCESCGVVQTIRRTDGAGGLASYEFSVRMRDGSMRNSTELTRGRWREGDHVLLIGGSAARALEQAKNAAP